MNLADIRFVKGVLLGILAQTGQAPALVAAALAACAVCYMLASIFTKSTPTPEGGG